MHVLIETKSRWRLTLTSPHHDATKKAVRHRVKPFACGDSASRATVERSLEAYGIQDNVCSEHHNNQKPSRCRSFRKFCRLFVHVSRTRCFDRTCPFYQGGVEDTETPPPYSHDRVFEFCELPEGWSSFRELPGPNTVPTGIFAQDPPYELPGSLPEQSDAQFFSASASNKQSVYSEVQLSNKRNHPDMAYAMQDAFYPLSRLTNFPNRMTEQPLHAVPVLTTGGPSQDSSPISPFTPGLDMNDNLYGPGPGFHSGIVAPTDLPSPDSSMYAAHGQPSHNVDEYYPVTAVAFPGYTTSVKVPTPSMADSEYFFPQFPNPLPVPAFLSHHNAPYQQLSYVPGPSDQLNINPGTAWYSPEPPRNDTREVDQGSRWIRQPRRGADAEDASKQRPIQLNNTDYEHDRVIGHVEDDLIRSFSNGLKGAGESPPPPKILCEQCNTEFTGEYRKGNLKRHVRQKHSSIASVEGKTCHLCNQSFKRGDAKRKHDWQQHHLPSAKPKKRGRK